MDYSQIAALRTGIPGGYTVRPASMADVEEAVRLFNLYSHWQSGADITNVEEIRREWSEPEYIPEENILTIWNPQGEMVGYIEFYDKGDPHAQLFCWGVVHPEHHGKGLGGFLLEWVVERARQNVPLAPEGARVALHQSFPDNNPGAAQLFKEHGFHHIRSFYRMRIDLNEPPAQPVIPAGITIRAIQPGEERVAIQTAYDAFRDHWGFAEEPFENYFQRWEHHLQNNPDYDPSLFFIAMAGDEAAGVSLCYDKIGEDPDMGWVGTLGVRRAWRKRGLGLALLHHSFGEFYRRGKPRAGLGVDASSLTGAVRLYERAGMRQMRTYTTSELELRPGKDLLTREI